MPAVNGLRTYGKAPLMGLAVAFCLVATGSVGLAKPALRDVPQIDDGLFQIALADQIRKKCPDISARLLRAYGALRGLAQDARALGYSDAEVEAFVESDVEKARMRKREAAYFKAQGFRQDAKGYCSLGRKEIERNSAAGRLLRVGN